MKPEGLQARIDTAVAAHPQARSFVRYGSGASPAVRAGGPALADASGAQRRLPGAPRTPSRPSGTEDVVRVYAEAATREATQALARTVAQLIWDHAGGTGTRP